MSTDTDYTPAEYAQFAGVVNKYNAMKLAADLDPSLPRISIQIAGDYLTNTTFWSIQDHRTDRQVKRFHYGNAAQKKDAQKEALEYAAGRYDIQGWGKVIGIRETFIPQVTAQAITAALNTARRDGVDPDDFKTEHGR